MAERASAQLCLSGKGEKEPLWRGRREGSSLFKSPAGLPPPHHTLSQGSPRVSKSM